MATLLVLHGPNLNLLGTREPGIYGALTLPQIDEDLVRRAREGGHHLLHLQSNAEYELIERIHAARGEGVDFIIINPAAFTHTSVALRDALLAVSIPIHRGAPVERAQARTFPASLLLFRRGGGGDLRPGRQRLPAGSGSCSRTT